MKKIKLGDIAKCRITGFEGVVVCYSTNLNNCDRAGLKPPALKDGAPADNQWFDVPMLEQVTADAVPFFAAAPATVALGDVVKDSLSPLKGTVTSLNTWISGCIRAGVHPSALEKGLPVEEAWLPIQQLQVVTRTQVKTTASDSGGPMKAPQGARNPR